MLTGSATEKVFHKEKNWVPKSDRTDGTGKGVKVHVILVA